MVDGPNGAGRIETVTVGMLRGEAQQSRGESSNSNSTPQITPSNPEGEPLPATGPVTQGELLRQEQEAGIVVNNPHSLTTSPTRTTHGEIEGGSSIAETIEGEEEAPHARGPELIGMEDTGPQKPAASLDIEGAVGRPSIERASKSPGPAADDAKDEDAEMAEKEGKDDEKSDDVEMKAAE